MLYSVKCSQVLKRKKKDNLFFTLAETWAQSFDTTWLPVKVIASLSQDFLCVVWFSPFSVLLVPQTTTKLASVHTNLMKVYDRRSWMWNIYYVGGILETLGLRCKLLQSISIVFCSIVFCQTFFSFLKSKHTMNIRWETIHLRSGTKDLCFIFIP